MRIKIALALAMTPTLLTMPAAPEDRATRPGPLWGSFLLEISSDGNAVSDTFELWWLSGTIDATKSRAGSPPLSLTSVVFTNLVKHRTNVLVEPHDTLAIEEVQPALFRLRFSGNGKACSDLEVVMRYSADYSTLQDLSGSARGGANCEHTYTYRMSRQKTKSIPPLTNGLYLAFPSLQPPR
jgi:hypothetical protein